LEAQQGQEEDQGVEVDKYKQLIAFQLIVEFILPQVSQKDSRNE